MFKRLCYILTCLCFINHAVAQDIDDAKAHAIIRNGTIKELQNLLKSGYDIDRVYQCQTLLTAAIKSAAENPITRSSPQNALTKIQILLDNGANYNQEPCPNESLRPIFWAISLPYLLQQSENELNQMLEEDIQNGTEYCDIPNIISKPCKEISENELQQIRQYIHKTTQKALKDLNPYFTKIMKLLLSRHVDLKKTDGKHQTVLHYAAALPPEITTKPLEILLQKGIFVDPQNDDGQTPLFFAYGIKNKRAVNLLLNAGADLTMRDKNQMLYNQTKSVIIHPNSYKDGALSIELEN